VVVGYEDRGCRARVDVIGVLEQRVPDGADVGYEGRVEGVGEEFDLGAGFRVGVGGRAAGRSGGVGGVGGVGEVVDCEN
jgi:hypothetical protein